MKKTAALLMILILAVSCTTVAPVGEAPTEEPASRTFVRPKSTLTPVMPPYLPGMEPEGVWDEEPETIEDAIARLEREGKLVPVAEPVEEDIPAETVGEAPVSETTEESDREEEVLPAPPVIVEAGPVIEECDEDLSEPGISEPVSEGAPAPVGEAPEQVEKGEPGWLTVLPETGEKVYCRGSSENYPKLTTGIMLAESDALRNMKEAMWKIAVRESLKAEGREGEPSERAMEYVPYRLKTEKVDTYVGKDGIVNVLISADRASAIDWMLAASSVIIGDGWTDYEGTLRSVFAELI